MTFITDVMVFNFTVALKRMRVRQRNRKRPHRHKHIVWFQRVSQGMQSVSGYPSKKRGLEVGGEVHETRDKSFEDMAA